MTSGPAVEANLVIALLVLTLLYGAALAATGILAALVSRPLPDRQGPQTDGEMLGLVGLAAAWGFGVVPALSFMLYLAAGVPVAPTSVLAVALVSMSGSAGIWELRRRHHDTTLVPLAMAPVLRVHRVGGLAILAVAAVYFLRWDRSIFSVGHSCIHQVGLIAVGALPQTADVMRENIQDARLGNPAVIAAFLGLFQGLGPRLLYAGCGALIAGGAYTTGVRLSGRPMGLLALVLLALNPWLLKNPLVDENLLALATLASFAPWLLGRRAPWLVLGVVAALALGMRHVLVLAVPAWLLAAAWPRDGRWRWRPAALLTGTMALGTLPWHLHHHLAMGSVFRFESFGQVPPQVHDSVLGSFQWEGMLNWPLYAEVVRTPHNAFPTFALWPLWLLDHFGVLLCAVAAAGVAFSARGNRRGLAVRAAWLIPLWAALALQEKWDDANKMGVGLLLLWPILEWMLLGVKAAARQPLKWGLPAILAGLALLLVTPILQSWQVPADPRYAAVFPEDAVEVPGLLEMERRSALDVGLLPDIGRLGDFRAFRGGEALRRVAADLHAPALSHRHAPWGWPADAPASDGLPTEVTLSLANPPWDGLDAGESGCEEAPTVDLVQGRGATLLGPVAVPWATVPVTLLATPGDAPWPGLLILHGDYSWLAGKPPVAPHAELPATKVQGEFRWLLLGDTPAPPDAPIWRDLSHAPLARPCVRLRVRTGPLALALATNLEGARHLVWRARAAAGRLHIVDGGPALHN